MTPQQFSEDAYISVGYFTESTSGEEFPHCSADVTSIASTLSGSNLAKTQSLIFKMIFVATQTPMAA